MAENFKLARMNIIKNQKEESKMKRSAIKISAPKQNIGESPRKVDHRCDTFKSNIKIAQENVESQDDANLAQFFDDGQ